MNDLVMENRLSDITILTCCTDPKSVQMMLFLMLVFGVNFSLHACSMQSNTESFVIGEQHAGAAIEVEAMSVYLSSEELTNDAVCSESCAFITSLP